MALTKQHHAARIDEAGCTVEEREEYEPCIAAGHVIFAGIGPLKDVAAILRGGAGTTIALV